MRDLIQSPQQRDREERKLTELQINNEQLYEQLR